MFPELWQLITAAVVLLAIAGVGAWLYLRTRPRRSTVERARKLFHLRREWLEARFFTQAAHSGKPRGLEWVECDFEDEVSFARDRHTGQLRALVGVTINAAASLNRENRVGSLEVGKQLDAVLIDGTLADLVRVGAPVLKTVIKRGITMQ